MIWDSHAELHEAQQFYGIQWSDTPHTSDLHPRCIAQPKLGIPLRLEYWIQIYIKDTAKLWREINYFAFLYTLPLASYFLFPHLSSDFTFDQVTPSIQNPLSMVQIAAQHRYI